MAPQSQILNPKTRNQTANRKPQTLNRYQLSGIDFDLKSRQCRRRGGNRYLLSEGDLHCDGQRELS